LKATLIQLAELQAIDTRIKSVETARESVFSKSKTLEVEVQKQRTEFKTASLKLDDIEKEKRAKELELMGERDKAKKWEGRLEDLRNTREYAALEREVGGLKRAIQDLTDTIQTRSTEAEAQAKVVKDLSDKLSKTEAALKEEQDAAKVAVGDREATLKAEREARAALAAKLKPNVLKKYEQLLAKRGGLAVVVSRDSVCKGCSMGLPAQQFIRVQRGETLEECPACLRILYPESILDRGAAQLAP